MVVQAISHFKKLDFWVLGAILVIAFLGLNQLYFIDKFRGPELIFVKQLIFFILGIILSLAISFFPCELLKTRGMFVFSLYLFSLGLLFAASLFAETKRGVESWLTLGYFDIQPVELMKITLLLVLAKYFSSRQLQIFRLRTIFMSCLYVLLPVFLTVRQPDIGSAAILVIIWFGISFLSGIRMRHFLIFAAILLILAAFAWNVLSDYQKSRITAFLSPLEDPLGKNYNALQSKIAIGSGGLFGRNYAESFQTSGAFLPEPHTDFIFASFVETRGFFGALILLSCYLIILTKLTMFAFANSHLKDAARASNFGKIFSLGLAVLIFSHVLINIGITLQLFPVTGIPLSFLSYGGSHLVSLFIAVGVYQSFYITAQS